MSRKTASKAKRILALALLAAVTVLGAQSSLQDQAAFKVKRFVRVFEMIRSSDSQINLVENVVYTVFFTEAGPCPRRFARPVS